MPMFTPNPLGHEIDAHELSAALLITSVEGLSSNNNNITIPTSAAVIDYVVSERGGIFDIDNDTPLGTPLNNVYRIRHGFDNYLSNSGLEYWLAGTTVAPSNWILSGDATIARSTTVASGTYSAEITFGTANTGEFFQSIPIHTVVDYTFSCYVQRTSGTGTARLVAQEEGDDYTEYASVALPTGAGWNLITLTVRPASAGSMRFAIKSADGTASVWLIDECMFEESAGVASTWTPTALNDTDSKTVFGTPSFAGGANIDTINELTSANGITVDGFLLKDGSAQTGILRADSGVVSADTNLRKVSATITASTTQTQGQQPLTAELNIVTVCANAGDVVTLPPAQAGLVVHVYNGGAANLSIYPASGDNLGQGVDTLQTLATGGGVYYTYRAYDNTNWLFGLTSQSL